MIKIIPTKQNNLSKISAADCFQIRSVSVKRFNEKIGNIETEIVDNVKEAITKVIGAV